jgi:RimJ/RimL family protein N-acetyltransferase
VGVHGQGKLEERDCGQLGSDRRRRSGRTRVIADYGLGGRLAGIGYWVVPAAQGRGIAPRALVPVSDWAINELGLHRLELEHSTRNQASCRVAEKAGYSLESTKRSQALHQDGWHDMHLHVRLDQRWGG